MKWNKEKQKFAGVSVLLTLVETVCWPIFVFNAPVLTEESGIQGGEGVIQCATRERLGDGFSQVGEWSTGVRFSG